MKNYYKINEISKLYNIGVDSIRYYEELGILHPKRASNGYRQYTTNDIHRLNVIRDLRSLGFSMQSIKAYLENQSISSSLAFMEKEEKIIACAMTVAETERAAIIGAVAVLPEYQRQGIGTSVVQSLLYRCMVKYQKHIYVYCNSKENALFYRTIGFTDSGVWAESEQI